MTRMRVMLLITVVSLVCGVASAGPDDAGEQGQVGKGRVIIIDVPASLPAQLSPDGKSVVCVDRRVSSKAYCYWRFPVDGGQPTKLFNSPIQFDDIFVGALGHGIVSPNGKRLLVLTTDNGQSTREGGIPQMVICSMSPTDDRPEPLQLPSEKGSVYSAVFVGDDTVWYLDQTMPRSNAPACLVRSFDLRTKQAKTVFDLGKVSCGGLTLSPDGKRLGAFAMNPQDSARRSRFWVCDITKGKWQASHRVFLADYLYDGQPWVFWSADGLHLFANGNKVPDDGGQARKTPFSILQYTPDVESFANNVDAGNMKVLQENRNLLASMVDKDGIVWATDRRTVYRVRAEKNQAEELDRPLLPLARQGSIELCWSLEDRTLAVVLPAVEAKGE